VSAGWSTSAFGLTVRGDFPAPGLDHGRAASSARQVVVTITDAEEIARRWPGTVETVCERKTSAEALVMRVERSSEGDHRISAPDYGTFLVTPDGRQVMAAPGHPAPWRWQRYLIGQALPLAAVLQGIEVLHASAVVIDGLAVAFAGASFAGKTTLAMALLQRGAELVCDDVLAIEPAAGEAVLAHPGPAVVNLRHQPHVAVQALDGALTEVGRDAEAVRGQVRTVAGVTPLAALYILDRGSGSESLEFAPAPGSEARLILASSFNFIVMTADRLHRQLDVCARLANRAEVAVLRVPAETGPAELASVIFDRMREKAPCAA
jgi:hypothetical protein